MMMSKRVCFSPEATTCTTKNGAAAKVDDEKKNSSNKKVTMKVWMFKLPKAGSKVSVGVFFKNIGDKVARALPERRRRRCSCKVSSSTGSLGKSRSYAVTLDSQRAEAIEDCIEFLNSSSSLQRSNSVSSSF